MSYLMNKEETLVLSEDEEDSRTKPAQKKKLSNVSNLLKTPVIRGQKFINISPLDLENKVLLKTPKMIKGRSDA